MGIFGWKKDNNNNGVQKPVISEPYEEDGHSKSLVTHISRDIPTIKTATFAETSANGVQQKTFYSEKSFGNFPSMYQRSPTYKHSNSNTSILGMESEREEREEREAKQQKNSIHIHLNALPPSSAALAPDSKCGCACNQTAPPNSPTSSCCQHLQQQQQQQQTAQWQEYSYACFDPNCASGYSCTQHVTGGGSNLGLQHLNTQQNVIQQQKATSMTQQQPQQQQATTQYYVQQQPTSCEQVTQLATQGSSPLQITTTTPQLQGQVVYQQQPMEHTILSQTVLQPQPQAAATYSAQTTYVTEPQVTTTYIQTPGYVNYVQPREQPPPATTHYSQYQYPQTMYVQQDVTQPPVQYYQPPLPPPPNAAPPQPQRFARPPQSFVQSKGGYQYQYKPLTSTPVGSNCYIAPNSRMPQPPHQPYLVTKVKCSQTNVPIISARRQ